MPPIAVVLVLPRCEDVSKVGAISNARAGDCSIAVGGALEFELHGALVARPGDPTVALR